MEGHKDFGQSLRSIQKEAVPWSIMAGATESFMIPYALALGATTFQVGFLSSFRNFVLSFAQLFSADLTSRLRSRKKFVFWSALAQGALWIPIACVAILFREWAIPALIVLYTLGTTSAALGAPAWGSIVSEYLAPEERGRFFSRRNRTTGIWVTVTGLAAGVLLQGMSATPLLGFGLLCVIAAVSRFWSCRFLAQLSEEPWHEPEEARFSFWEFISQIRTNNFVRFTLCLTILSFGANMSAPYLTVYMLKKLHYSYLTYSAIIVVASVAAFLTVTRWGKIADRFGNWVVLRLTLLGISVFPFMWTIFRHPAWLFTIFLIAGVLWGGLNLCMVNFVYDAASPEKRTRYLAYFNVVNGCGVSLGALTGGWLIGRLPSLHGSPFITLFYLSGLLRLTAALAFPRMVKEVRQVKQVGLRQVMDDFVGQPLR